MTDKNMVGNWIRRFLLEYLVERQFAQNTQKSYRDTLALMLPFTAVKRHKLIDHLTISDISAEIVRQFLLHLEQERKCSAVTRNQRLATIRSLARFIAERNPEYLAWCGELCLIPLKKTAKPQIGYLEKQEMDAILQAPDKHTVQGFRDYALLLFLYNSGARADEAAHASIGDLDLSGSPSVKIVGKGNKVRRCPLWALTVDALRKFAYDRSPCDRIFLNRLGQSLTRYGIYSIVRRYAVKAGSHVPSLRQKTISPHTIRHTTAVHLLRAGVDINTIRAWLGHVSLDTTNIYAEIDLEMKAKALARCEVSGKRISRWQTDKGLMAFLHAL
jgi:site-specific recombinase XerD